MTEPEIKMDLLQFCEKDPETHRPWLLKPYSIGEWTYATDGRLMVRVPRRDDVPENAEASKKTPELFEKNATSSFTPAPSIELPAPAEQEECEACNGRGHIHDCPSCVCKCVDCDGTGTEQPWHRVSFQIGGRFFNAKYIAAIRHLPGLKFGPVVESEDMNPMMFVFDGGEGLVMPMRGGFNRNIELKAA